MKRLHVEVVLATELTERESKKQVGGREGLTVAQLLLALEPIPFVISVENGEEIALIMACEPRSNLVRLVPQRKG